MRQRELDVGEDLEWQHAISPSLATACADAGMTVHRYRLLVRRQTMHAASPGEVRIVSPEDDLTSVLSTQQQGFGGPSTVDPGTVEHPRGRLESGATVSAAGFVGGEPVCVGVHQPVGDVSERGVSTVFLSAADDAVARVYERVGFRDVKVACAAEPAVAPP